MSVGQPTAVLSIAGTAPKLSLDSGTAKMLDSGNFTAMCWGYHTGGGDDGYSDIIAISDNNDVIGMASHAPVAGPGNPRVFSMGDLNSDIDGTTVIPDGTWQHYCMTVEKVPGTGTRAVGYLNGVQQMTGSLINPVTPLAVRVFNSRASTTDPGGVWIGNLCAVKIWDGIALTPAEIRREMWTYMARRRNNLYACSPMSSLGTRTHNYAGLASLDWTTISTFFQEGTSDPPGVMWDAFDGAALAPAPFATLSGTALAGITEADIVAGGKTIIITLTGDSFIVN